MTGISGPPKQRKSATSKPKLEKNACTEKPEEESSGKNKSSRFSWRSSALILAGVAGVVLAVVCMNKNGQFVSRKLSTDASAVGDKYKSSVVDMQNQHFLTDSPQTCPKFNLSLANNAVEYVHVLNVMNDNSILEKKNEVFFMLNGENLGVFVPFGEEKCLKETVSFAAGLLGADMDWLENGVRLMSQKGLPIKNAQELEANDRIAHILLDFQIWVWPGIKKGYVRQVDDKVTMTTISLSPLVFDINGFFSQEEADTIKDIGLPNLNRSLVAGEKKSKTVTKSRTSHTAFLPDSEFTRHFRHRSSQLARLPSPSFTERLQLVRYASGEFYRQHLDTFHTKVFEPRGLQVTYEDYVVWANWAKRRVLEFLNSENSLKIPSEFHPGQPLFPDGNSNQTFSRNLLRVFYEDSIANNFFASHFDKAWQAWLNTTLANNEPGIMNGLLKPTGKPFYLKQIIKSWENRIGLSFFKYTMPKKFTGGTSHYMRWIRWVKHRVAHLGDKCPSHVQPDGEFYPKFTIEFQNKMVNHILNEFSKDFLVHQLNLDWYNWLYQNKDRRDVLTTLLKNFPLFVEIVIKAWEINVGSQLFQYRKPKFVKHFHPQRFVTLFLYLNEVEKGGETVFPFSKDRLATGINQTEMAECSDGLAVPARGLHASLFYVQTKENDVDFMSRHGGCPPKSGVKWGSNSFMWNADADEGANIWTIT